MVEQGGELAGPAVFATRRREVASTGFSAFYVERYEPMVRLAVLLVDHRSQAEDVAQDAFAKLFERWGSVRDPAAYVRRAVVNRSLDVQRRRRLARLRPLHPAPPAQPPDEPLDDALRGLSARERSVVVLRFYEDLTIDAIAAVISTRPGTVKSLLHRAVIHLREVIDE